MSGDGVKGSNNADAQQNMPDGATAARPAGNGTHGQVTWVGAQHLMQGYCGRAVVTGRVAEDATPAADPGAPRATRPVALLQRSRGQVVRIGPKSQAEPAGALAKAA